jgi:hypothetical protein
MSKLFAVCCIVAVAFFTGCQSGLGIVENEASSAIETSLLSGEDAVVTDVAGQEDDTNADVGLAKNVGGMVGDICMRSYSMNNTIYVKIGTRSNGIITWKKTVTLDAGTEPDIAFSPSGIVLISYHNVSTLKGTVRAYRLMPDYSLGFLSEHIETKGLRPRIEFNTYSEIAMVFKSYDNIVLKVGRYDMRYLQFIWTSSTVLQDGSYNCTGWDVALNNQPGQVAVAVNVYTQPASKEYYVNKTYFWAARLPRVTGEGLVFTCTRDRAINTSGTAYPVIACNDAGNLTVIIQGSYKLGVLSNGYPVWGAGSNSFTGYPKVRSVKLTAANEIWVSALNSSSAEYLVKGTFVTSGTPVVSWTPTYQGIISGDAIYAGFDY